MDGDNRACNGKAKAVAAVFPVPGGFTSVETFENMLLVLCRDSISCIADQKYFFVSMGSIGNKLLLLVKGGLHRLGDPSGQEKDRNKDQDNAKESNIKADPQQPQRHGFFHAIVKEV